VFIVKAHGLWAFGLGHLQNIGPNPSEQANLSVVEQISGRVGVSPPVTTSEQGGDSKKLFENNVVTTVTTVTTWVFVTYRK
jgi:hypothetical protein